MTDNQKEPTGFRAGYNYDLVFRNDPYVYAHYMGNTIRFGMSITNDNFKYRIFTYINKNNRKSVTIRLSQLGLWATLKKDSNHL